MTATGFDVAIIGAGLGGLSVANALAARGARVALIDRFVDHPVCLKAEKLEGPAAACLSRLGFQRALRENSVPLYKTLTYFGGVSSGVYQPNPPEAGILYHDLINAMRKTVHASVTRIFGTRVHHLEATGGGVTAILDGDRTVAAGFAVLAVGDGRALLKRLGGGNQESEGAAASHCFAFTMAGLMPKHIDAYTYHRPWHGSPVHLATFFKIPGGIRANVLAAGDLSPDLQHDLRRRPLEWMRDGSLILRKATGQWRVTTPVLARQTTVGRISPPKLPGVIVLGDAAHVLDPTQGQGATLVLAEAELLGTNYAPRWIEEGSVDEAKAAEFYGDERRAQMERHFLDRCHWGYSVCHNDSPKWAARRVHFVLSSILGNGRESVKTAFKQRFDPTYGQDSWVRSAAQHPPAAGHPERVRICQITPTLLYGGMACRLASITRELADHFDFTWVGFGDVGDDLRSRAGSGVTFEPVPRNPERGIEFGTIRRIAEILRRQRPHVVHVHNWATSLYGIVAARMAGVPVVLYGYGGREDPRPASFRQAALMRMLARYVDGFTTVADPLAREIESDWGVGSELIRTIPSGVDVDRITRMSSPEHRLEARARLGIPEDALVLGTISVFRPVKCLPDLLEAAALVARARPNVHVLIGGEAPDRQVAKISPDVLRAKAKELGLDRVLHLPGYIPDAPSMLGAFDVFVNCSAFEGASNSLIEAMAAGIPVVATRVGGNTDLVTDDLNGVLVPPGSPRALGVALLRLLSSPETRRRLGRVGAEQMRVRHTSRAMQETTAAMYRSFGELALARGGSMTTPNLANLVRVALA